MKFESDQIQSLLNPLSEYTLSTVYKIVSEFYDGVVVHQSGNLFHIYLNNPNNKYAAFSYDPINKYVLTAFHYEHIYKIDQIQQLTNIVSQMDKSSFKPNPNMVQQLNQTNKKNLYTTLEMHRIANQEMLQSGYWHSYMYPVLGDLRFWCLFDGIQWLCMNATDPFISIDILKNSLLKRNQTLDQLDKTHNYQVQVNTYSGNLYIKRVIDRISWSVIFTDPLSNIFPFDFNSKCNKQYIVPNKSIYQQLMKQCKDKRSFAPQSSNPDLLPIIHLTIEAKHFFIYE